MNTISFGINKWVSCGTAAWRATRRAAESDVRGVFYSLAAQQSRPPQKRRYLKAVDKLNENFLNSAMRTKPSEPGLLLLKALGHAVRERRQALGLSQEELGELAGLHRTYVGSVERGERNMTLTGIKKIAAALQFSAAELIKRAES